MPKLILVLIFLFKVSIGNATEITVSPIGMTLHGTQIPEVLANAMPKRVDSNGQLVWHPELSILLKTNKTQYSLTFLKDCFDKPAILAGAGEHYNFKHYKLGWIAGIYAREITKISYIKEINNTYYLVTVRPKADFFNISKDLGTWEVMPMAFATLSIPISKRLETNIGTNLVLTHINLGFKF